MVRRFERETEADGDDLVGAARIEQLRVLLTERVASWTADPASRPPLSRDGQTALDRSCLEARTNRQTSGAHTTVVDRSRN